ncbi:MAG TPA: GNAT family N-acetyltransferase, partial [Candidatus Paceibacterota bacterium]|nr:GNAT family N-acetyltransferase [Candidatus Paceibacterota bacterium]
DSVRRAIRKAEKAGITLESSSSEKAIRDYYVLHCQTRRHHGLPPQPIAFFLNIQSHILNRGMGTVISARLNNRLIASAIFFLFGTESIYKFGASDRDHLPLRANNLVMWTGIQWCARQGAQVFQMGRTSLANEGLRRFKLGWGTTETRTQYFKFDLRQNTFVTDKDDTVGFHTRVFQAMPVILSRLVGSVLYRHIA